MNYFDFVMQNKSVITINQEFSKKNETDIFGRKYPNYDKGYKSKVSDCKFKIDNYYLITYKDSYDNTTKRIVKVKELFIYIKDLKEFKKTYNGLITWDPDNTIDFIDYSYHEDGGIFIHLENNLITNNSLPKSIFDDKSVEIFLKQIACFVKGSLETLY